MTAKSHHYNPQVYLRQFTNPASKRELWEYSLANGAVTKSKPKDCGCEDYYNSVALKGSASDDETIEKAFHPLENALPRLFEATRHRQPMTSQLWNLFYSFVAVQEVRGPSTVGSVDQFLSQVHQMSFEMLFKGSLKFQKSLGELGLDPLEAPNDFELKASKGSALLHSLNAADDVAKILGRMKWSFLHAPLGEFFFTSDRPMCRWIPPDKQNIYSGGLADQDVEITFPLSRRICACGHWTMSQLKPNHDVLPEVVDTVNRRTVWNAHCFVYGPTKDSKIIELIETRVKARLGQAVSLPPD